MGEGGPCYAFPNVSTGFYVTPCIAYISKIKIRWEITNGANNQNKCYYCHL